MSLTKKIISFAIVAILLKIPLTAQEQPKIGPQNGSLVAVGGAMRDMSIVRRIIQLAGGADAPLVMIPTAGGNANYDEYWPGQRLFREAGATDITIMHTYDPKIANTEEFVEPLRRARGVFFGGGRQWRLADSYLHTKTHTELLKLLERGGVIAGSSAGASIMGSYLIRGDTKTNTIMMGDHVDGLGFLKNVGIDQHLLKRNRHFDLLAVIESNPDLLGIGLDEDTAIVVKGDRFEVIGQSYVVIYDNQTRIPPNGEFYFLAPGDHYDMATRNATRTREIQQPIDRVKKLSGP